MPARSNRNTFIERSIALHGDFYDYSKVEYKNNGTKVLIVCPLHGEFQQKPRSHVNEGKGCFECGRISRYVTQEEFLERANKIHQCKYDYSKVEYTHSHKKIEIFCLLHGSFMQSAAAHLKGAGCKLCRNLSNTDDFIVKANKIHNNYYDYSISNYRDAKAKIDIICPLHGIFSQSPNSHLRGHKCVKCTTSVSSMETKWLDSLNIPKEFRQFPIKIANKRLKVDGFDPISKTVYEFYGDFWHGNPKIWDGHLLNDKAKINFGELYNKTLQREKLLIDTGFKIVSMWQSEFNGDIK